MPLVQTGSRGFALPLALSCSAVLLLSSLSLQTIALHGRQRSRQALLIAQRSDLHHSAAMDFQQRAQGANACLLRHAASEMPAIDLSPAALAAADLTPLSDPAELDLIRQMAGWPRTLEGAAEAHEPHRVPYYLYDPCSVEQGAG